MCGEGKRDRVDAWQKSEERMHVRERESTNEK